MNFKTMLLAASLPVFATATSMAPSTPYSAEFIDESSSPSESEYPVWAPHTHLPSFEGSVESSVEEPQDDACTRMFCIRK